MTLNKLKAGDFITHLLMVIIMKVYVCVSRLKSVLIICFSSREIKKEALEDADIP